MRVSKRTRPIVRSLDSDHRLLFAGRHLVYPLGLQYQVGPDQSLNLNISLNLKLVCTDFLTGIQNKTVNKSKVARGVIHRWSLPIEVAVLKPFNCYIV